MKLFSKQIIQWCLAIIVASLIMNIVLSFYNTTTGWVDRTKGATKVINYPNSSLLFGTEGRGFHRTDSRGYINDVDKLADDYIIVVGSSFTKGIGVESGERFTDILNKKLGYKDESFVYNVSQSSNYFPSIIQGFKALISEFPKSSKVIIEIGTTSYSIKELRQSFKQREFDKKQTGNNIKSTLSTSQLLWNGLKQYSPLFYNVYDKIKTTNAGEDTIQKRTHIHKSKEYKKVLDGLFKKISKMYGGEIIVMYHPNVEIMYNGQLSIQREKTTKDFESVCNRNNIKFVDLSHRFLDEYNKTNKVPYGFSNYVMGAGHLNKDGHRMIAEELLKLLK